MVPLLYAVTSDLIYTKYDSHQSQLQLGLSGNSVCFCFCASEAFLGLLFWVCFSFYECVNNLISGPKLFLCGQVLPSVEALLAGPPVRKLLFFASPDVNSTVVAPYWKNALVGQGADLMMVSAV